MHFWFYNISGFTIYFKEQETKEIGVLIDWLIDWV